MRQSVGTVTKLAHFWSETRNTQWHEIKGAGENNLKANSESYSGNVSNQDTTSKQHHSRTEITTKNMIAHMLSEQDYFFIYFFFSFYTCHIPGAWSISKCCPNSIRISIWLRRNFHCGERRSHRVLYHYIRSGLFSAMWRLFYIESVPGCIF